MLTDRDLAAYMKQKGHRWRVADKDVVGPDGLPPRDLVPYLALAKGKDYPQLFIVSDKGKLLYRGDLAPGATAADIKALMQKVGG